MVIFFYFGLVCAILKSTTCIVATAYLSALCSAVQCLLTRFSVILLRHKYRTSAWMPSNVHQGYSTWLMIMCEDIAACKYYEGYFFRLSFLLMCK